MGKPGKESKFASCMVYWSGRYASPYHLSLMRFSHSSLVSPLLLGAAEKGSTVASRCSRDNKTDEDRSSLVNVLAQIWSRLNTCLTPLVT